MILRRFENDVIFEELGNWNGMEALSNFVIGNIMAVIFEKYGMSLQPPSYHLIGDYWLYHKLLIEDDEEEKI